MYCQFSVIAGGRFLCKQGSNDNAHIMYCQNLIIMLVLGGYRDALKFHPGEEITFNPQAFIQSRPESMQPFLEKILHLQIFQEVLL